MIDRDDAVCSFISTTVYHFLYHVYNELVTSPTMKIHSISVMRILNKMNKLKYVWSSMHIKVEKVLNAHRHMYTTLMGR